GEATCRRDVIRLRRADPATAVTPRTVQPRASSCWAASYWSWPNDPRCSAPREARAGVTRARLNRLGRRHLLHDRAVHCAETRRARIAYRGEVDRRAAVRGYE